MKHIFEVTIQCADDEPITRDDIFRAVDCCTCVPSGDISVTETTAVHEKANALIGLLVDYATHDADMEINRKTLKIHESSVWARLNDLIRTARELRALMEEKSS